ncbi:Protoporphyrinogen oxidase [Candidatus Rhabdochlamydia oedothoracis]|uniref:Coproporphyrinogen III oxidase n=1 Tax=Candidatus Rhabdochlamydia oedothoracis TaxID=2720720 RepID=A0ABX8V1X6_9BACT|nr:MULTISPECIES: protoporphyrinogen oxidase [Rhabdochlamydia]KAG6559829.1 Protoporphyrinogen oxidase [Candidatus Rhabdochlamydia sp. W815]MCL6756399.1 protoporphyrinogen oxidase [Candidatus Rhabdochlamydia oedothoracis]QYF49247.1 Protoporphyrinogen oxidase [Candidatus Rhabdochlamydia oedothoracis]
MEKKKIIILGAGISGLSAAWYLSQISLPLDILILEKSNRIGGLFHTDHTTGFHFEKGPRTFKINRCPATLQLAEELGLLKEVVWSEIPVHNRYLWWNEKLYKFPTNLISFLWSPLTKGFIQALITEWKRPTKQGDETVWEFVLRRFNYDVAQRLFDPMVVGIFGGDPRLISIQAFFPKLKEWEEEYGSITKGFLKNWLQKKRAPKRFSYLPNAPLSAIFSFREGVEQLTSTLLTKTPASIYYQHEAQEIVQTEKKVVVKTNQGEFAADYVFCALPALQAGNLFIKDMPSLGKELVSLKSEGIIILNFGYKEHVLPVKGFGYLIPHCTREDILGVVFDSSVLKQHNNYPQETRLTIKLKDLGQSEEEAIQTALLNIRKHLKISMQPDVVSFKRALSAIPQYTVGHLKRMASLYPEFQKKIPRCYLLGNYLIGVSVDYCIRCSKETVQNWHKSLTAF